MPELEVVEADLEVPDFDPVSLSWRLSPTGYMAKLEPFDYRPRHLNLMGDAFRDVVAGREDRLIITMPPRHAKALALDTPLPTPSGWTTMGEVKLGDELLDEKGQPCRVTAKSDVLLGQKCYRVVTSDGDEIIADAGHRWALSLDRHPRTKDGIYTTEVLARPRGKRAMVRRIAPLDLPEAELPIDPYVLGVWLGDGATGGAAISAADDDAKWIRAEIETAGFRTSDQPKSPMRFGVLGLYVKLRAEGLLGNKHVPPAYLRASRAQRLSLLQGLIDTDGSVAPDGQVSFVSVKRSLADAVLELVRSLGVRASLHEGPVVYKGQPHGLAYRVMFYMAGAARIPRKADRCRNTVKRERYLHAEPTPSVAVQCVTVDSPSHLFLAGRSMTPTHNSTTITHYGCVWALDLHPEWRIMIGSYEAGLAQSFSYKVRETIRQNQELLRVRLDPGYASRASWATTKGGGMQAAGVGGPFTGRGANLFLIDDPFKNWVEAHSIVTRDKVWNWYRSTVYTRLQKGGAIIILMTRWHEDDLVGRLATAAEEGGDKFRILNLPALADEGEDDELGRAPGEALWPEEFDEPDLRRRSIAVGSYLWAGMYQGRPSPEEGGIFRRSWWKWYDEAPEPLAYDELIQSWDMSFKDTADSSFVVGQVWGRIGAEFYLVDQIRDRMDYPTTRRAVLNFSLKWWRARPLLVEDKANGSAIIADLTKTIAGMIPISVTDSKLARARAVSSFVEAGNVYLPSPSIAPWINLYVEELAAFPNANNDDQVDATTQALLRLTTAIPGAARKDEEYQDDRLAGRR